MAKCDEGYLCDVCGDDVESITESDLYLRFVVGLVDPEVLHTARERHIHCNPAVAQFIVDEGFPPVACCGEFDKRALDAEFVAARERLITSGWRRLREIAKSRPETILEYLLPEAREKWERASQ